MTRFLPYGRQAIDRADIEAVIGVLESDFLTTGPAITALESDFARTVSCRFAVACANGTAALHLAMLALGIGENDLCIVPTITFMATANAVRLAGGEAAFADVDPTTGLMRPQDLEQALARASKAHAGYRIRAVLPVHLGGQPAPTAELAAIAAGAGAVLVEDACHALGTRRRGDENEAERIGDCRHAAMATFSFHPVKTVAAGEGGMVATNDARLARHLAHLRSHGIERDPEAMDDQAEAGAPWYHEMPALGLNYRLSDLHAALARSQLARLGDFVEARAALVHAYEDRLRPLAPIVRPTGRVAGAAPGWHLMQVLIDFDAAGTTRSAVMDELRAEGIGTQVHYIPVHRQPYYRRRYGDLDLPGAEGFYRRTLSLPLFVGMDENDIARVVGTLEEALDHRLTDARA